MNENSAKVSIVLPTYNGAKYICQSIDSCLNQTYKNIELIIVDDGSTDNTPQIIKIYTDPRIIYIRQDTNSGLGKVLNKGFSNASGEYLTWSSDDNFYHPEAIEIMLNILKLNKRIDFVYANFYKINEKGDTLSAKKMGSPRRLSIENCIGACFLYTRKVYKQIGDYRSLLIAEDYEYWLRVREKFRMQKINKYLYYYRVHPNSISGRCNVEEGEKVVDAIRDKYISSSTRCYVYVRKQFYKGNYIEAKKLLKKCILQNLLNIDIWRITCLLYLPTSLIKIIKKIKWGIISIIGVEIGPYVSVPKNILQIISCLESISGGTKTLYLLAVGLAKKGYKVTVAYYTGGEGILEEKLLKESIEVINLGWNKKTLNRLERIRLLFKLRKLINTRNIEVLHAHNSDSDWYGSVSAFPKNLKKIITVHSASYFEWARAHHIKYKYIIFPLVDKFVCVCEYLAKNFSEKFSSIKNKISVIYNSPDADFFLFPDEENKDIIRKKFSISENELLIGFVGNVSWYKGIEYLLQAVEQIKHVSWKLLLAGECSKNKEAEYMSLLKRKEIRQQIIFTGFQEDIAGILDAVDIFVLPSIEEADPWVLSEAMARSKPIIASNVGGIPEKIKDGENGILVPPADSQALAQAINFLINNPLKAKQMGLNARDSISKNFPFEKMIRSYEELYTILE